MLHHIYCSMYMYLSWYHTSLNHDYKYDHLNYIMIVSDKLTFCMYKIIMIPASVVLAGCIDLVAFANSSGGICKAIKNYDLVRLASVFTCY